LTARKEKPLRIPSREECLRILVENGCDESVVRHCVAVSDLAVKIARRCRANIALVEAGSLLHDLGRCKSHGIDHAVQGAKVAGQLGLHETIVRMIERHIGGGITRAEAKKLGLPPKDYVPQTLEEKIVAHADSLIAGERRTTVKQAVEWLVREGHEDAAIRVLQLHEDISRSCGMDVDEMR
jgi:tRNA (cytidine56-2'-O)-methyltransferase